jgi:uncharacterized protein YjbI with pentapeptide repeats
MKDDLEQRTEELVRLIKEQYGLKMGPDRQYIFDPRSEESAGSAEVFELYQQLRDIGQREATAEERLAWIERKRTFGHINMDGADLRGLNLSYMDLSGMNFGWANFEDSDLTWTNLSGSKCMLANFSRARLHLTNMVGILAVNAHFIDTLFTGSRCSNGVFNYANFTGAFMELADFSSSHFQGASFERAIVSATRFDWATGIGQALKEADVRSIVLHLSGDQFVKAYS